MHNVYLLHFCICCFIHKLKVETADSQFSINQAKSYQIIDLEV